MAKAALNPKPKPKVTLIRKFWKTVADGTPEAAKRIERVLTTDPGMGIVSHFDAGYVEAIEFAENNNLKIPMNEFER